MNKSSQKFFSTLTIVLLVSLLTVLNSFAEGIRIVEADGAVDQYFVDAANEELECVPEDIIWDFTCSGWHIYVTDKNIDDWFFGGKWGSVMGCTSSDNHAIYIEDREVAVRESPVHELGHWFDFTHGRPSQTSEFSNIYNEETDSFYNTFNYYSHYEQEELWAECFWKYFADTDTLRENCPKTYAFIESEVSAYY